MMDAARSPAELVAAMLSIVQDAPDGVVTDQQRREVETLGHDLMQSEGATLLDAFAFLHVTISLLAAMRETLEDSPELGRLCMAELYVSRARETLGNCMDARASPSPATANTIH